MRLETKFIDFNDDDLVVKVTKTQVGDMIIDAGVFITTAFDGTSPVLDLGFTADNQGGAADPNALGSALAMGVAGAKAADELATATNKICTATDTITASLTAGTAMTAGKGYVWVLIANIHPFNEI